MSLHRKELAAKRGLEKWWALVRVVLSGVSSIYQVLIMCGEKLCLGFKLDLACWCISDFVALFGSVCTNEL